MSVCGYVHMTQVPVEASRGCGIPLQLESVKGACELLDRDAC